MTIAVVTDSTSDVPDEVVDRYHIEMIRNLLVVEGVSLVDGIGITRQEFYNRLPTMKTNPTTATASSGIYEQVYERLLSGGAEHIFSVHASAQLSGIFNAASLAAQSFPGRVTVFDSLNLTMGLGFQAIEAARAALEGISREAILRRLESMRPRAHVYAMLDTLEYIRRSGRVSWAKARLGNLLQLKPFVEVSDGRVNSQGEARTRSKGIERLIKLFLDSGPLERLAILHTNAEDDARRFAERLPGRPAGELMYINVTTVIGSHVGPNALGFAVITAGQ